jgi:3-oxoacyl-[acyl-carrier protein] reductase
MQKVFLEGLMKTVLVTGGSRGIGREIVRAFAACGHRVAFTYLNSEDEARALSAECGALAIKADCRSEAESVSAVERVISEYGKIDVLVNNAGISDFSLFTDITLENWNNIIATNLTSAFLYSRECVRDMLKRKSGAIVNLTSMWGIVGSSCEVAYSSAKAALIGMTKALAKELGPSGIRVNAVAPGVINTDMNKKIGKEDIEVLKDETPLMRIGEPFEIARAVLFLSSDESSFITGDVINASGGFIV